jgi:hypothetical protein
MRILVISILALSLSAVAFAADPTTEVTGGSTVSAVINPGTNGGNTTATVALAGAAAFAVGSSELQLGVAPSLAIATGGGSTITTFSLFGLARLNFSGPIQDSAFIEVGPGLEYANAFGASATDFAFIVGVGKRFQLARNVSWIPQVGYTGVTGSNYTSSITVSPFSFSIFF